MTVAHVMMSAIKPRVDAGCAGPLRQGVHCKVIRGVVVVHDLEALQRDAEE